MEEFIDRLLNSALDFGISEMDFWEMTPGEVDRSIQSKIRVRKIETQERASYDYILANLIIKGVNLSLGGKGDFPSIEEAYPGIFDDRIAARNEEIQEQKMNLSALRFKQFAQSYNRKFKEVPKKINE